MRLIVAATIVAAAIVAVATTVSEHVEAKNQSCASDSEDADGDGNNDTITAECLPGEDSDTDSDDDTTNPFPDCRTEPLTWAQLVGFTFVNPNIQFGDGNRYYPDAGVAMRELPDGTVERGILHIACATGGYEFVDDETPEPDPVVTAIDSARRRVPDPHPDLSPLVEIGGFVNLGVWLAVSNGEPVSVTATGRGTSVTVTATLHETAWDMGDGTSFTCPGAGEPIDPSELDTIEQGPCGHTYRAPSPTDDPYTITVTATWNVTWVTADGRSGTAEPIVLSSSFPYPVVEIQTVGRNN